MHTAPWSRRIVSLVGVLAVIASCRNDQHSITEVPHVTASITSSTVTLNPTADTRINLDAVNYSTDTLLTLYTWPAGKVANAILMKFDLSSIPAGATVSNATLNLYQTDADATADPTYTATVHRIINHNPDLTQATGYKYDGAQDWTHNACCFNNVWLAQADISAPVDSRSLDKTNGIKLWDVTSIIQAWLNNPSTNFGLLLNSDPSKLADRYRYFASSRDATHRPYLTITYTAPSSSTWPKEPFGFTALVNEPWNEASVTDPAFTANWIYYQDATIGNTGTLITSVPGGLVSQPSTLQFDFPTNAESGYGSLIQNNFSFHTAQKEIYFGTVFQLSPNFVGHSSGIQKLVYLNTTGVSDWWLEVYGGGTGPYKVYVVTEFTGQPAHGYRANETDGVSTDLGEANPDIARGVWHTYEVYLKLPATSGGPGTMQVWIDGTLTLNRDPNTVANARIPMWFDANNWTSFNIDPIWGGVTDRIPADQQVWYDHTYVSQP
jgi:hypothetical protein